MSSTTKPKEQIWDSIVGLVARNPWSVQRPTVDEVAEVAGIDLRTATIDDVERQFDRFATRYAPAAVQRRLARTCGYRSMSLFSIEFQQRFHVKPSVLLREAMGDPELNP